MNDVQGLALAVRLDQGSVATRGMLFDALQEAGMPDGDAQQLVEKIGQVAKRFKAGPRRTMELLKEEIAYHRLEAHHGQGSDAVILVRGKWYFVRGSRDRLGVNYPYPAPANGAFQDTHGVWWQVRYHVYDLFHKDCWLTVENNWNRSRGLSRQAVRVVGEMILRANGWRGSV